MRTERVGPFLARTAIVAGAFLVGSGVTRAIRQEPAAALAPMVVSTLEDEVAEFRKLDQEGEALRRELDVVNARRTAHYENLYGRARGRLGLPIHHPIQWTGQQLVVAPVTTAR